MLNRFRILEVHSLVWYTVWYFVLQKVILWIITFFFLEKLWPMCIVLLAFIHLLLFFSPPVMSDSLQPHGLQHTRPPYPLPSPKVCPSSCPLHQWCHPAISSSDALFSFCPQSFPVSGMFPVSRLFASGDQNTAASASALVFLMSIQGWFPVRVTGLISLLSKGLSGVYSITAVLKAWILHLSAFFTIQLSKPDVNTGKAIALIIWTFVSRVKSFI